MLLILTIALTSCRTLKNEISTVGDFPEPYDTEGVLIVTYDDKTELVSMPLWYWKKIVRFAVDAKGVEEP